MKKRLEGLQWKCMWVSHLGCIKGCLEYLNIDVSDAWLFGATGHAFVINVHELVCPSGPTAWHTEMLFKLGKNNGYTVDGVWGVKTDSDFSEKQRRAWDSVRHAIDEGIPCYGWQLDIPEYYVIYGYDDAGYYFSGPRCDSGKGPKPWEELGDTKIGWLEVYSVRPGEAADEVTTVKEAFAHVLEHAQSPEKWIYPRYKAGLAGFDTWIDALEQGNADGFGTAYNAVVWRECREMAVRFLGEAKERIGIKAGSLFDEMGAHYEVVADNFRRLSETFPFPPEGDEIKDSARREAAIEYLRKAREAEELGLKLVEKTLKEL
jgi:hypothetical protein